MHYEEIYQIGIFIWTAVYVLLVYGEDGATMIHYLLLGVICMTFGYFLIKAPDYDSDISFIELVFQPQKYHVEVMVLLSMGAGCIFGGIAGRIKQLIKE